MKLKLSNVSLTGAGKNFATVDLLCQFLEEAEMLSHLDISWTKLCPEELVKVSETLKESNFPIQNMRNLNISYNLLTFDSTLEEGT